MNYKGGDIIARTGIMEIQAESSRQSQSYIPRKKCRMDVPGPVKDIILQYLR